MSLKVWLPLRGDLENKGISEYNISSTNATVNANGKIGKCLKIISKTSLEYIPNFNTSSLSFGGWFKFNKSEIDTIVSANNYTSTYKTSTGQLIGNSSYGGIGLVWVTNNYYTDESFDSMSVFATLRTSTVNNSTSSISINFDEWIHIFLIWNIETHTLSLYKNGNLINSKVFSDFSDGVSRQLYLNYNAVYGGNAFSEEIPIYCNDVRIYDHALSKMEVKEISQGLILHYKLNSIVEEIGIDATKIIDSSGYNNHGTITGILTTSNTGGRYNSCTYIDSGDINYITTPVLNLPGDAITLNFWFKSTNTSPGSDYHMPLEGIANSNQSYECSIHKTGYYRSGLIVDGVRKVDNCTSTKLIDGNWHMCTTTYDGTTIKRYVDAIPEKNTTVTGTLVTSTAFVLGHYGSRTSYHSKESYESDVRIYTTALSQQDIEELYHTSLKIDNFNKMHTFELEESGGRELIQGINLTSSFSIRSDTNSIYRGYNENGEIYLSGPSSIGSKFIPISPTGKIYYYDIEVSADSDNVHYIGFERYDAIKTSTSNNSCIYPISSRVAQDHVRYKGIIDLSTDINNNPTAFIVLRILNDWSNGTTRKMTIHHLSLREVTTLQNQKVNKNGILLTDEFRQYNQASFYKNGFIEATNFIER